MIGCCLAHNHKDTAAVFLAVKSILYSWWLQLTHIVSQWSLCPHVLERCILSFFRFFFIIVAVGEKVLSSTEAGETQDLSADLHLLQRARIHPHKFSQYGVCSSDKAGEKGSIKAVSGGEVCHLTLCQNSEEKCKDNAIWMQRSHPWFVPKGLVYQSIEWGQTKRWSGEKGGIG